MCGEIWYSNADVREQTQEKPRKGRRALQLILGLLVSYVALALLVMLVQRRLIYLPSKFTADIASAFAKQEGFREWRNKSGEHMGWHIPATSTSTSAVLVIHGNAGCALNRGYLAKPIHAASGADVYVLEYPGYGCREGSPSQETVLSAAEKAMEDLSGKASVYVVSESLGTGAAAHLAEKFEKQVSGMALFAPYDKLTSVGQSQMPFLPVGLLLRDRYNPAASLKKYRGPVKVIVAGADTIIPPRFAQRLYDGYGGPKEIEVIPGAGHNDIAEQSAEWWRKTLAFWHAGGR